ncbi:type II secretion system protein [Candidatus Kuenenbacteria bacterium]|nr:type II secretion system protein [Candidatus Kuenenbacteria bacterium]
MTPFILKDKNKAFTLIELLVAIAIIGLLATLVTFAIQNAGKKSRDTRRLSDLKQINTALQLYYDTYKTYPTSASYGEGVSVTGCTGGWDCSHVNQDGAVDPYFMEFLVTSRLMAAAPKDPINDNNHHYKYYYYSGTGTTYGCERPFYVLVGFGFEAGKATGDNVCYTPWANNNSVYVIISKNQ